ncbi:MAG: hypothetical protein AAGF15_03900 [Pseudomonadota bacterium]
MCLPVSKSQLHDWLQTQIHVMEAWSASLAEEPEIDAERLRVLERHRAWLLREIDNLRAEEPVS